MSMAAAARSISLLVKVRNNPKATNLIDQPGEERTSFCRSSSSPAQSAWVTRAERSNILMLRVMTWISLRCGRRPARAVLVLIAAYFVLFAPAARRASRQYLRRALRREPVLRDVFRQVFSFAATIHDRVFLLNDRFDLFDIRLHGERLVEAGLEHGSGVLLVGAHLGSFEVLRAIGRGRNRGDLRMIMLMHEANARKINAMLGAINPQAMQDVIPLGQIDSMLLVREKLESGALVGILADRSLRQDGDRRISFLGAEAAWSTGPFRIAALLRLKVIFMAGLYLGGNRYDVHFETLADFSGIARAQRPAGIDAALLRYVALVEHYCHEAPYNWFNFFDVWETERSAGPAVPPVV